MPIFAESCKDNPGAWYCFNITRHHPPDDGIDIGTPDNTPLWFPYSGTIVEADYYVYGGQMVEIPDDPALQGVMPYFIHMNRQTVKQGDHVLGAESGLPTIVGTSGGGIGDLLIHNGQLMPAESQSWFEGHSDGYHTEYGEFLGHNLGEFNEGWHNPPRQLDPTPVYDSLQATGTTAGGIPPTSTALNNQGMPLGFTTGGFTTTQLSTPPSWMCNLPVIGGVVCAPDAVVTSLANDIGTGLATGLTAFVGGFFDNFGKDISHLGVRVGVFVLGAGIILLSLDRLLANVGLPEPVEVAKGTVRHFQNAGKELASTATAGESKVAAEVEAVP